MAACLLFVVILMHSQRGHRSVNTLICLVRFAFEACHTLPVPSSLSRDQFVWGTDSCR